MVRRPQRHQQEYVIRGYRTVYSGAATVLAGSPPWKLEMEVFPAVYNYTVAKRDDGVCPGPRTWRMRITGLLPLTPFGKSLKIGAIGGSAPCRCGLCRCYPDMAASDGTCTK